jgi:hypothetical protein
VEDIRLLTADVAVHVNEERLATGLVGDAYLAFFRAAFFASAGRFSPSGGADAPSPRCGPGVGGGSPSTFGVAFQRAAAAFLASAVRFSGVRFTRLRVPSFHPKATAAGLFFLAIGPIICTALCKSIFTRTPLCKETGGSNASETEVHSKPWPPTPSPLLATELVA